MTNPRQQNLEAIIKDSVANQDARKAQWDADLAKEKRIQAVHRALREHSPIAVTPDPRLVARIAVEALDEMKDQS